MEQKSPRPDWAKGCLCNLAFKSLGTLHNVRMGRGWVRVDTDPSCPQHRRAGWTDPR